MIKLAKWVYDLGYKHGWDKAVASVRAGDHIISSEEGEQMRLEDEMLEEMFKEAAQESVGSDNE